MLASEMITKFRNMVDDELNEDFEYQLLNDAMHEVEEMSIWEVLKASQSFSTTTISIPSDFSKVLRLVESESDLEYKQIPYEQKEIYDTISYTYYFDWANDNVVVTDPNSSTSKVFYYLKTSTDLTSSDIWAFPSRFHSIIPLKMAELYYSADAGEKARSWDDRWANQYERMLNRMYQWNDSLKSRGRRLRTDSSYNPKAINNR